MRPVTAHAIAVLAAESAVREKLPVIKWELIHYVLDHLEFVPQMIMCSSTAGDGGGERFIITIVGI